MATPPDFSVGQVLTSATMNKVGLWLVADGALSTATTDFVSCFNDDYRNYRIVISDITFNATGDLLFRMLSGSTPAAGATDYQWAFTGLTNASGATNSANTGTSFGFTGVSNNGANNIAIGGVSMDVYTPKIAIRTMVTASSVTYPTTFSHRHGMAVHNLTTAYDGIRFLTNSATTVTGNVRIYGYN
jgi:hypothetical protein